MEYMLACLRQLPHTLAQLSVQAYQVLRLFVTLLFQEPASSCLKVHETGQTK